MDTDRTTILSLALTLLLVTSVLPPGIVGLVGTANADHGGPWYTVRQAGTTVCHEVRAFTYDHPKMEPEVDVRGEVDDYEEPREADVYGDFRDPDWDGFESIESIMDYRYRHYADDSGHAVGQTEYYAPYLNDQYRNEAWEYGTYGLYNWSDNGESHMFFYQNPNGEVSLVVRHDRIEDTTGTSSHNPYNGMHGPGDGFHVSSPGGGAADWTFRNLPNGEWAYIDDMYPRESMDDVYTDAGGTRYGHREAEYTSAPLENFNPRDDGRRFRIDWTWGPSGTDGGAYRGFHNLGSRETVIEPSFSNVDAWQVRHYDGSRNGNELTLDMNRELVIEQGRNCPDVNLGASPGTSANPPEVGETVTFTADVDGSVSVYEWDFDGDGTPERETSEPSVDYTFNSTENRDVSVTVETSSGVRDSDQLSVQVSPNEDPTARLNVDPGDRGLPEYHIVDEQIVLNATGSTDNSGPLAAEYQWNFGDGTSGTGDARVAHTYNETGTYEVSVQVSDPAGNTDTETMVVEIDEPDAESPTARADLPEEVEAGAPLTFDGSASEDNRGIQTYRWDVDGDGGYEYETSNATLERAPYGSETEYDVSLQVEDGNGNTGNETVSVTVLGSRNPNVTDLSVPSEVSAGEEFEVSSRVEDKGRVDSVTYRFSDGTSETVETDAATGTFDSTVTHTFDSTGTPEVWVVARDAAGNEVTSERSVVNVTDAPNAELSVTTETNETETGDSVTFDAGASSDASGEVVEYRWDFDGDDQIDRTTNASEPQVTTQYDDGGTYDAAVTVVDDTSRTDTATVEVEVEEDERAATGGGSSGGTASLGPPPVSTQTEETGPNSAAIDVRNARSDETITAGLPASEAANRTGVQFERVAMDIRSDDPHVVFETAASADAPDGTAELTRTDETLAYLQMDSQYLDKGVKNATVEFTVQQSAVGQLASSEAVSVYQYDDGWKRLNATVVETTDDALRLKTTTDSLGTLAVGASPSLAVSDAGIESDTVAKGDDVTATATVENTGSTARTATVNLTFDGTVAASETVEVPAGETADVTLTGTATTTGSYEAAVGGVSVGTLAVKETIPADTAVTDVSLSDSTISAGETVEITATVENTGGEAGEQNVTLTMFDEEIATKSVEVPAGETTEVTFERRVDAAGNYTVEVNDRTADLGVAESNDGGLGDEAPDVPGFGVGVTVVALLAAALLARMRD
jgi:PGF-CTERM protein